MLSGRVEQLKGHRRIVTKSMARWRIPVLPILFAGWYEYVEESKEKMHMAAQQAAMAELKHGLEQELDHSRSLAVSESSRRMETCKRVVNRMIHIQLANAFDSYSERVMQSREKKSTAKRIMYRMLHTQLAAAFDCFSEAIDLLKAHRETAMRTIANWRTPIAKAMFERWLDFIDSTQEDAFIEGNELAKKKLAEALVNDKSLWDIKVQEEKDRRINQAKRIVVRMLHSQLAGAFDSYVDRVETMKIKRLTCQRIVHRMLHTHLAAAFDLFCQALGQLEAHRQVVEKAMSRWRKPMVVEAFGAWSEVVESGKDLLHTQAQQAAMLELKQGLEDECERVHSLAGHETERRIEMCKRTVNRMFHIQLATIFDTYRDRVAQLKAKRQTCQRLLYRMLHTHLAAAFDGFCEAIEQLAAHRLVVAKTIARWQHPVLPPMFERWAEFVDDARFEAKEQAHEQAKQVA